MTIPVWLPPLVRAVTTASLVVTASVAAEALGPLWGALIASLPVSSGPAYIFLAIQHGDDFIAASALSSFVANASTGVFLVLYAALAGRMPRWRGLGVAVLAWFLASFATSQLGWTPSTALLLNLLVYGGGIVLLGMVGRATPEAVPALRRRWFDLPVRTAAVVAFVSLVVAGSSILGPAATGIAAVFPITLISLIVIVRARVGGVMAALLAANALRGMLGFGMMLLALHLAARPLGSAPALALALLVSASWSTALLLLGRRTSLSKRFG